MPSYPPRRPPRVAAFRSTDVEADEDTRKLRLRNDNFEQNMRMRKHFGYSALALAIGSFGVVVYVVAFSDLPPNAQAWIATSNTAASGIFGIVLKYLFPNQVRVQ